MANIMRWRYGETNPVTLPVDSDTEIEIGDLILLDTNDAKPASSINYVGDDPSCAQRDFHEGFTGVAMQRSRVGDTQPIRIATSGVFEFDVKSSTFALGDRVGATASDDGTLSDQSVIAIPQDAPERCIGMVAKHVMNADTKVLVDIRSTMMRDGPAAA